MSAINVWRGDAPATAQVTKVTPSNVVAGDSFTIACNGKPITYIAQASSAQDVVAGLVALISATTISEFSEMLASASSDGSYFTLVAVTAGVPFEITATTSVTSAGNVTISEVTPGKPAVNEVWQINLLGNYTGGTFTATVNVGGGNVTTGNISYAATAAVVQAAFVALAGVGAGQCAVTGGPGPNSPWFVTWTGTLAGTSIAPGTINGANLTGSGSVQIVETQAGWGLSDEIQIIDFTPTYALTGAGASIGGLSLGFNGQTCTVSSIMTASQMQTAITGMGSVGAGNAIVYTQGYQNSDRPQIYVVHFVGALAGAAQSLMTIVGWPNPPSEAPAITRAQSGGLTSADNFQWVDLGTMNGVVNDSYTLSYGGKTTGLLDNGGSANGPGTSIAGIQAALQGLSTIGAGNCTVYGPSVQSIPGQTIDGLLIRLTGALANTRGTAFSAVVSAGTGPTVTTLEPGQANTNEIQNVTIFGTGGTFTLSENSQATAAIAQGASAATVQAGIIAAFTSTLTAVTVSGAGTLASPYVVTLTGPAHTPMALMTGNGSSLTGGGGTIAEQTQGAAGVNEVQLITEGAGVNGGTMVIGFGGLTTTVAWNVSSATMQTDLRALATINTVTVTGSAGGPYTVTWSGAQGNSPQGLLYSDGTLLTGATGTQVLAVTNTTFSTGPNHFNEPLNWTLRRVPDSATDIHFESGNVDCLYGTDQLPQCTANTSGNLITFVGHCSLLNDQIVQITNAGGALPGGLTAGTSYYIINMDRNAGTCQLSLTSGGAAVTITSNGTGTQTIGLRANYFEQSARYTGAIGLPNVNDGKGYYEYRQKYLHFGMQAAGTQKIVLGIGDGSGSQRIKLHTDGDQVNGTLITSGGELESGIPAVLWQGTNAANVWNVINGDFGAAVFAGETAVLAGPLQLRGGSILLGAGCTMTGKIDNTGGKFRSENATINGTCLLA